MIEAIKEIGEYSIKNKNLDRDNFLNNICIRLNATEKKKNKEVEQHVIFLNFDTSTKETKIDFEGVNCKNAKNDSGKAYLWFGNFEGNKPQINITSNKLKNILSKTLPSIRDKIDDGELKKNIEEVIKVFFDGSNKKDYCVKSEAFEFSDEKSKEIKSDLKSNDKNSKNKINLIKKNILTYLGSKNIAEENISIYTVKINDKLVCQYDEYKQMIYNEKIFTLFNKEDKDYKKYLSEKGTCSVCGSRDKLTTSNTTNLAYKFYITDKIGFSFGLDETFKRNFNLCSDCYQYIMIGERFIQNNLKTQIANLNVYIIPRFVFKVPELDPKDFSKYISHFSNSIINLENLEKFEDNLKREIKYEYKENNFVINYLFYQKSKSEFKILKLIRNIPPTRLDEIRKKEEEISNLVDKYYDRATKLKICLNNIWGCIPVKQVNKTSQGVSKYLDILDAIFSKGQIDYNFLINQFTEVIRIIKFERPEYNISTRENFINKILQLNFLLLFLKKLNILKDINKMENKNNTKINDIKKLKLIPEDIFNYWENIEIYKDDNSKKSLFLLGYIIGEIGREQKSKDIKNKPILNKINFQGMDIEKLKRLSNEVFEKLRQYGKLQYNEKIFTAFKMLFDENVNKWKLSNQENVFYVLSGYAFLNYFVSKKYEERPMDEISKKQKEIQQAKETSKDVARTGEIIERSK